MQRLYRSSSRPPPSVTRLLMPISWPAQAQHELGNIDEAIVSYLKAAALDASCRKGCYRMLALLHEKTGRLDEAVRYYKRAIKDSRARTGEKAT